MTTYDRNSYQQFKNTIHRSGTLQRSLVPVRYAAVVAGCNNAKNS